MIMDSAINEMHNNGILSQLSPELMAKVHDPDPQVRVTEKTSLAKSIGYSFVADSKPGADENGVNHNITINNNEKFPASIAICIQGGLEGLYMSGLYKKNPSGKMNYNIIINSNNQICSTLVGYIELLNRLYDEFNINIVDAEKIKKIEEFISVIREDSEERKKPANQKPNYKGTVALTILIGLFAFGMSIYGIISGSIVGALVYGIGGIVIVTYLSNEVNKIKKSNEADEADESNNDEQPSAVEIDTVSNTEDNSRKANESNNQPKSSENHTPSDNVNKANEDEIIKEINERKPNANQHKCSNCGNIQSKSITRCLKCSALITEASDDDKDTESANTKIEEDLKEDYEPYDFACRDEDNKLIFVKISGVTYDPHYNLNLRKSGLGYEYSDCASRSFCYDIDKLDEVIEKIIECKPKAYRSDEKIYVRITNDSKAVEWVINNKDKINKCKDNGIDFVYGFDLKNYEDVYYNITLDCFTMIYDTYAGYGAVDCAATYYDVHETDYSFDNESKSYFYGRELHKLFKRDYRYPLDDIRLAFLSEYFEEDHNFSFDFEKACDSHYKFNESEFEKIRAHLRKKYKKPSVEAIKEYILDYTTDNDASSESAIVYLLNQLNIKYQSFHFD